MFDMNMVKKKIKSTAVDNHFDTFRTQCNKSQLFRGSCFPKTFFWTAIYQSELIDMIEDTPVIFDTLLLQPL